MNRVTNRVMSPGGVILTADEKLVTALAGTPWSASVLRLHDVP